jgi:hypothetical protein
MATDATLPINKSIFYKWQNRFFAKKVLMQHINRNIAKEAQINIAMVSYYFDLRSAC